MPTPEPVRAGGPDDPDRSTGEALEGLLEFTGATAGWVGLRDAAGRLAFPARRGAVPDDWLRLQRAEGGVWGFAVREGPTLLNDLRGLTPLGVAGLENLLSCPLGPPAAPRGHVVLANKPHGFTSHDAAVLQGVAHLLARRLERPAAAVPEDLLHRVVDRVGTGVLVVDAHGTLVFANAAWLAWTGFTPDEIAGKPAPFPFWLSHRELAGEGARPGGPPAGALPFRRRDNSVFWCRVETLGGDAGGPGLTAALLHPVSAAAPTARGGPAALPVRLEGLPFGVALTDRAGRVLWTNAAADRLLPRAAPGGLLRERVDAPSAAALERLARDPARAEAGRMGFLALHAAGRPVTAFWLAVDLPDGPGFLYALTDADGFPATDAPGEVRSAGPPAVDWLAVLLHPGAEVAFWDERWERLTGLSGADLGGVRGELVLDWLFPRQRDRNLVADWLHDPRRRGGQAVLEVLTRTGGRPMLCTFLPVVRSAADGRREHWLLLAGESELFAGPGTPSLGFVRQFARGLGVLLNHYLNVPVGLAEMALDRTDLPTDTAGWFQQILDSCQRATRLLTALDDLAADKPGETAAVSLAALVREFLDELPESARRGYELKAELNDAGATVRVNRRMLRTVLKHLFDNARDALASAGRRQIEVRVEATDEAVRCEFRDTGEGLPVDDWTLPLTPFFSTKGAFARDPAHVAQEAAGLGLTVSQHLLALQGGHLELRSAPGEGTTAALVLPRAPVPAAEPTAVHPSDTLRQDRPARPPGPHARPVPTPPPS
jgi:PAS domain S-box-containing protein